MSKRSGTTQLQGLRCDHRDQIVPNKYSVLVSSTYFKYLMTVQVANRNYGGGKRFCLETHRRRCSVTTTCLWLSSGWFRRPFSFSSLFCGSKRRVFRPRHRWAHRPNTRGGTGGRGPFPTGEETGGRSLGDSPYFQLWVSFKLSQSYVNESFLSEENSQRLKVQSLRSFEPSSLRGVTGSMGVFLSKTRRMSLCPDGQSRLFNR